MNDECSTNFLFEVESIQYRLMCGINALGAIQSSIANGPSEAESYFDGLYAILEHLEYLNLQLEHSVNDCIGVWKRGKQEEKCGFVDGQDFNLPQNEQVQNERETK